MKAPQHLRNHNQFMTVAPLFSVIVPLEYHRGQWERCWLGWQSQTLPRPQYEMILVVPPDFPEQDKLPALLGPQDRLIHSDERHDVGLSAVGAARARGKYLFFTEAHCWPEADVLEKCIQAFEAHPEWAAFSCQSSRIAYNRISDAEADMYEADIEYGMQIHPWRKVLDQCFVTRRDCYDQCGGLEAELGHFSEWVLAATYFHQGLKVGYLSDARLHHYYIGHLAELRAFTRDFTIGEMRYFAGRSHAPGGHLLETPPEWICQGNWNRLLAGSLARIATWELLAAAGRAHRLRIPLRNLVRWLYPALTGAGAAQTEAAAKVYWAFAAANIIALIGSKARLSAAFRKYVAALIHHQRLAYIRLEHRTQAKTAGTPPRFDSESGWNVFASENAGFYPVEVFQGTKFRWSETAAIIPIWMPAGRHRICIECLPIRSLLHEADLRFYFNERSLSAQDISIGPDSIDIKLDVAKSRPSTLAWTCFRFSATDDRRWLGLPIKNIAWNRFPASSAFEEEHESRHS
jgi:hypothetical protein